MLTYLQWNPVIITRGQFHKRNLNRELLKLALKLLVQNSIQILQGIIEKYIDLVKMVQVLQFWVSFGPSSKIIQGPHYTYFMDPGAWFSIAMPSYQYRNSHCGDKTILLLSYLHNVISYTGKTTSSYWIRGLSSGPLRALVHVLTKG